MQAETARLQQLLAAQQDRHEATVGDMERRMKGSKEFLEQKEALEARLRQLLDTLAAERKAFEKQIRSAGPMRTLPESPGGQLLQYTS